MNELANAPRMDAAKWNAVYQTDLEQPTIWERRLIEHFVKRLPQRGSVLLLGCGAGKAARAVNAFRPDLRWHGADFSEEALSRAREFPTANSRPGPLELPFEWQSLTQMDLDSSVWANFDGRQFDAVIASEILEYLADPPGALRECARIASRMIAATFPISADVLGEGARWQFQPLDPWRFLPPLATDVRVHHLKSGKVLLAFATPNGPR